MLHCLCHAQGTTSHLSVMLLDPRYIFGKYKLLMKKPHYTQKLKGHPTNDILLQNCYSSQELMQVEYNQNYANQL